MKILSTKTKNCGSNSSYLIGILATFLLFFSFARIGLELIPCRTQPESDLGLQYVTSLPENTGLLFTVEPGTAFHTHNCLFPIDWACFSKDFKLLELKTLAPEGDGYLVPAGTAYVIETNPGFFAKKGIKTGRRFCSCSIRYSKKFKDVYALPRNEKYRR